jgi:cytochrome c553
MRPIWPYVLSLAVTTVFACANGTLVADDAPFASQVKPFLATYCVSCHGAEKQKGDRRFDQLTGEISDDATLVDLQDIVDQLNLAEMPPKKSPQPKDEERRRVVGWLTAHIGKYHEQRQATNSAGSLRRLNSREYRNSVRDLLHFNMSMFDPTVGFPSDRTTEHLDNIAETLVTSGALLERYLNAADRIVEKALTPAQKPEPRVWRFTEGFRQQPEIDQVHGKTNGFSWLTLYDVPAADKPEGAYAHLAQFKEGVPFDGNYVIRFKAEALNRQHPYDREFVGTNPDEPLRLGVVVGNARTGPMYKPQPIEPKLAELELADEPQWYTVHGWLDAGFAPRFTFPNGLMDARNMWGAMSRKYKDQFPPLTRGGIVEHRYNVIKFGKLPQIHIYEVEIEGPFYDEWPTPTQRAVLGDDWHSVQRTGELSAEQARQHLAQFASRAYRRPIKTEELDRLMQVVTARREAGRSPLDAYGDGLKAVLCSPSFLYLDEPRAGKLPNAALASRLSYFLWSSSPDPALLAAADSGKLGTAEGIKEQTERLLTDSRSEAFLNGFLDSWLTLRDLGSMPPDRTKFDDFYRFDLHNSMKQETRLFAKRLLDENLSIRNFLDADFTYINQGLARLYGLPAPRGGEFQLVNLSDRRRGGLLGQGSVLTVTANGIDTSPVVRGVWLLENILGTPPNPPPPDVEPLDPDIRGAQTIREQLEKHRNVASCYDCHRKIDPLGFALENYDAIGGWRDSYSAKAKIESAGELPSGQKFAGVEDFKQVLLERQDQFAAALTTKLLAYATGRQITSSDRPEIDAIVRKLNESGGGFRDLIHFVTASKTFQSK